MDNSTKVSMLVDFEMIVNVDYGIIKLIDRDYRNGDFIDIEYLDKVHDFALLGELYNRVSVNPLEIVLKDEYKDQADSLYSQIYREKYSDVLELAHFTNLYSLILSYLNPKLVGKDEITITIMCKNLIEEHFIKLKNPELNTIIISDSNSINVDEYDYFYIKEYEKILSFPPLKMKNIYVARYGFNKEPRMDNVLKLSISDKVSAYNQLFFIDIYSMEEIKG